MSFERSVPFDKRKEEAERIRSKYPDRIPVIVENSENSRDKLPLLDKKKFLVPMDLTMSQFIYVIRKRMLLKPEQALFLYVNKTLVPTCQTMMLLYNEHKSSDGFIYFTVMGENTFGTPTNLA